MYSIVDIGAVIHSFQINVMESNAVQGSEYLKNNDTAIICNQVDY